jgi:hypothetical protein
MIDEQEFRFLNELPKKLHLGEASSLAIAYHRHWLFLTDDMAAQTIHLSSYFGYYTIDFQINNFTIAYFN